MVLCSYKTFNSSEPIKLILCSSNLELLETDMFNISVGEYIIDVV